MGYLIVEMIVLLLIAAVIGFIIGWFLRRGGASTADLEADYKARLEAAESRAANLNKEVEDDQAEIERLRSQLEATRREVSEEREKAGVAEGDAVAIREKEAALAAALNDVSNRDSEIERLKAQLSDTGSDGGGSDAELAALRADVDRLTGELDSAKSAHADCTANESHLTARVAELESQLATAQGASSETASAEPVAASAAPASTPEPAPAASSSSSSGGGGPRPDWLLDQPDGEIDDLKRIKGVGPVMERTMNELGIYHFRQVARLDAAGIEWVSANIETFPDRIRRDRWVEQAHELHTEKYGSAP